MGTSSSNYGKKLKAMRTAERMTQQQLSDLANIPLSTIKHYETGQKQAGIKVIERILALPQYEKYLMWLMSNKTAEVAGQISPSLSPDGYDDTFSPPEDQKAG